MRRSAVLLTLVLLGGLVPGCQTPPAPFLSVTSPDVPDSHQPLDRVQYRPWIDQRVTLIATSAPPTRQASATAQEIPADGPAAELRISLRPDGSVDGAPVLVVRRNGRVIRTGLLLGKLEVARFADHLEIAGEKLEWRNGHRGERLVTFKVVAPNPLPNP